MKSASWPIVGVMIESVYTEGALEPTGGELELRLARRRPRASATWWRPTTACMT